MRSAEMSSRSVRAWVHRAAGAAGHEQRSAHSCGRTGRGIDGVFVIPDNRVGIVPNVGIVVGQQAVLVIRLGPRAPQRRLRARPGEADRGNRPVYLTITHFHPSTGSSSSLQGGRDDCLQRRPAGRTARKGAATFQMFRDVGEYRGGTRGRQAR